MKDGDDLDTWLARTLHGDQLVALATLQELLTVARADRGESLARQLVQQGLLGQEELDAYLIRWPGLGSTQAVAARDVEATRGPGPDSAEPEAGLWRPGGEVGPYRIEARIGAGGMGTVYRAEHRETGVHYAIKSIAVHPDSEDALRFQREGEAQAMVDAHPHVAKVHAAGQAGGRFYLVMDLAAGGDLAQRLQAAGGSLPLDKAISIGRALALALAHLHGRGVLHRDMKPSNVLFDDRDQPRLVDFGLAKVTWQGSLTESGTMMGTPAYMAPEQAQAHRAEIGPPTDIYGLGAVIYEMLTGKPPLEGASVIEILTKLFEEEPAPPSTFRREIPPGLDSLCSRMLAKDPKDRPTATQVVEALETALDAPSARPLPRGLVPGVLAAVGILAVSALWAFNRPAPAPSPSPPEQVVEARPTVEAVEPSPSATPAAPEVDLLELFEIPLDLHESLDRRLKRVLQEPQYGMFPEEGKGIHELLKQKDPVLARYWVYLGAQTDKPFQTFRWGRDLVSSAFPDLSREEREVAKAQGIQHLERAAELGEEKAALYLAGRLIDRASLQTDAAKLREARDLLNTLQDHPQDLSVLTLLNLLALADFGKPTQFDDLAGERLTRDLELGLPWAQVVSAVAIAQRWAPDSPTADDDDRAVELILGALAGRPHETDMTQVTGLEPDEKRRRLPHPGFAYRALARLIDEGRVSADQAGAVATLLRSFEGSASAIGDHERVEAWYPLALAYEKGLPGQLRADPSRAKQLLERAARHDHHLAEARLAR